MPVSAKARREPDFDINDAKTSIHGTQPYSGFGLLSRRRKEGMSMRILRAIGLALAAIALPLAAQSQPELKPQKPLAPPSVEGAPPASPSSKAPSITAQDVDAWLGGFLPYALHNADIPGAVVVVVKDGQVLTQRGFGYADVKAQRPVDPAGT